MRINYLTPVPHPAIAGTDALFNEMEVLKNRIGGELISIFPYKKRGRYFPGKLFGFPKYFQIKASEAKSDINHIYAPELALFPIYSFLKKPIVYNVVGSISPTVELPPLSQLKRFKKIIVSNERDYQLLKDRKVEQAHIIPTGIDQTKFSSQSLPLGDELVLMMASAPWMASQFQSKGIHLLLQALQGLAGVKIIFIWRGLMAGQMRALIAQYQVADKVTFVNEKVAINNYFKQIHGTILITNKSEDVKAYPHSLLESLTVSKPIILTDKIPMSKLVSEQQCGLVLNSFTVASLIACIQQFKTNYATLAQRTQQMDKSSFSVETMTKQYMAMYEEVLKNFKA